MSLISPELSSKITHWRMRAATGELSLDEMREAITHLRAGRVSALAASHAGKKAPSKAKALKADDLLSELDDL